MANIEDIIKLIEASKNKEDSSKKYSIHYLIYFSLAVIILILTIALCYLASKRITDLNCRNIVESITNFATILSIILSISSILFAYFTSRDTNNQYAAMGKALEEVRATNLLITLNNSDLVSQVNSIANDVSVLNTKYDLHRIISQSTNTNNLRSVDPKDTPNIPANEAQVPNEK